jgi:ssRNA-specific RNase YbeY (16S rRNA maturation enzyme)
VHGILHTVGFDDVENDDRRRMRDAERAIMKRLKLHVREVDA